jgi:hypothetical protein
MEDDKPTENESDRSLSDSGVLEAWFKSVKIDTSLMESGVIDAWFKWIGWLFITCALKAAAVKTLNIWVAITAAISLFLLLVSVSASWKKMYSRSAEKLRLAGKEGPHVTVYLALIAMTYILLYLAGVKIAMVFQEIFPDVTS